MKYLFSKFKASENKILATLIHNYLTQILDAFVSAGRKRGKPKGLPNLGSRKPTIHTLTYEIEQQLANTSDREYLVIQSHVDLFSILASDLGFLYFHSQRTKFETSIL